MEDRLVKIAEPLLTWYDENRRILPWRDQPTPYRVWVSEIMLQQTRVEAVKPFYQRFMKELPGIRDLAECPEEKLLKLWEGLGYYNRVRNMQKAAVTVMNEYDGRLPDDYEELQKLSGIGSYTAGAVASIAYGKCAPAVDGNVLRVISRVICNEEDILKAQVKKKFEKGILRVIPIDRPGAFNQALMELGAVVCVPNGAPKCDDCPLKKLCLAHERNCTDRIPYKAPKKKRRIEERTVFVIRNTNQVALRKRPDEGLLSGMYELPNVTGYLSQEKAVSWVKEQGFVPIRIRPLDEAKHIFSHVEWRMTAYMVLVEDCAVRENAYLMAEAALTEEKYPIPAAFRAYAKAMKIRVGQEKYMEDEDEIIIDRNTKL